MSLIDKIDSYLGPDSESKPAVEEAMFEAILEKEEWTDEDVQLLEAAGTPEAVGWYDNKLIVAGWNGKNYAYVISPEKLATMVDKYGNFGPVGARLSGESAGKEYARRIKSLSQKVGWIVAFQKLIAPATDVKVPYAGGLKSSHAFEQRWLAGINAPTVVGGKALPGHTQPKVPGARVPVVKAPAAPALSHATKQDFGKLAALKKVSPELLAQIGSMSYAEIKAMPPALQQSLHKVHDALQEFMKASKE